MDTGDIYKTNFCGNIEVINYINNKNVRIKFIESGHMKYTTSRCIRLGEVKDPYSKTVFSVGYLGEGRFTSTVKGKTTEPYVKWYSMIRRCHSVLALKNRPTYSDCTICKDWYNFQSFAEWWTSNKHSGLYDIKWELDKDLLSYCEGKVYSPNNCSIISASLNSFMTERQNCRGDFKIGVCERTGRSGVFLAYCNNPFLLKQEYLGQFDNEEDAHYAYKLRKFELAKELAYLPENIRVACSILNKYKIGGSDVK